MPTALVTKNYNKTKYFIKAALDLSDTITYDSNTDYDYILPHPYVSNDAIEIISLYNNSESIHTCLDKNKFYKFCQDNNFLYPKHTDKFPCVIKPTVGESSEGVIIAYSIDDIPDNSYITQQYITGKLIGLNIAVYNNQIVIYNKWIVDSNIPGDTKLVNVRQTTSCSPLGENIISEVERMIKLLNFNNEVLQLELFVTDDEQDVLSFVELNPRTGSKGVESLYSVCGYCPVMETVKLYSGRMCEFKSYKSQKGSLSICLNTSNLNDNNIVFKDTVTDNFTGNVESADDLYKKYGFIHVKYDSYEKAISNTNDLLENVDRV